MTRWTISVATGGLLVLLAVAAAAAGLPDIDAVPGGLVAVPVASEESVVRVAERRQPVFATAAGAVALVGIPLDTAGTLTIVVDGARREIALAAASYREQHLTIARQDYVTPSAEQLKRYRRERAALDAAIGSYSARSMARFPWPAPVPGRRSDTFGARRFFNGEARNPHRGMDIAAAAGTEIVAPDAGRVVLVDEQFFSGNTVVVDHGNGIVSLYAHLSRTAVAVGDVLERGTPLGNVGATGRVTGPHLHFAVYVGGTAINPALVLSTAQ